jgi:hypothetical protein
LWLLLLLLQLSLLLLMLLLMMLLLLARVVVLVVALVVVQAALSFTDHGLHRVGLAMLVIRVSPGVSLFPVFQCIWLFHAHWLFHRFFCLLCRAALVHMDFLCIAFSITLVQNIDCFPSRDPDQCKPSGVVRRGAQARALFRSMQSGLQECVCTTVASVWQ